jgi:hypothetical protein
MIITTGTLTACAGGSHLHLPVTINSVTREMHFTREEFIQAGPDTHAELHQAILLRLRSAVLEATTGVPTPLQVRNAVSGKTFEV